MALGSFILKKLKEKDVSLYALQKATKISYSYLLAIEKGKRNNPSYDKLKKIAQALEIDLQELLEAGGFENKTKTTAVLKTVTEKAPQRIPLMPWSWFIETENIVEALKAHSFRQFRYTMIKDPNVIAVETGKGLDEFPQDTTLILQYNIQPELGQKILIKSTGAIGIYTVSQVGQDLIAVPQNQFTAALALSRLDLTGYFIARVREAVLKF